MSRETLLPVCVEPLLWSLVGAASQKFALALAEMPPSLLRSFVVCRAASCRASATIAVVGDILYEISILAQITTTTVLCDWQAVVLFSVAVSDGRHRDMCTRTGREERRLELALHPRLETNEQDEE